MNVVPQGREANVANVLAETESMTYLPSAYTLLTQRDPSNQVKGPSVLCIVACFC